MNDNNARRAQDIVKLSIADSVGGTLAAVVHWTDIQRNSNRGSISVRDAQSGGYDDSIAGDEKITYTITLNYQDDNGADAGADNLMAISQSGIKTDYEYIKELGAGLPVETGEGFITQATDSNGDPVSESYTLEVRCKPTYRVQV